MKRIWGKDAPVAATSTATSNTVVRASSSAEQASQSMATKYCRTCIKRTRYYDCMDISVGSLRQSASFCSACSLLYEAIVQCIPADVLASDGSEFDSIVFDPYNTNLRYLVRATATVGSRGSCGFEVFVLPGSEDGLSLLENITRIRRIPPENTGSSDSVSQVNTWLNNCTKSHVSCGKGKGPLPTRVIDVKPYETGTVVRLHESRDESDLYLCLSHCWGKSQPKCMTTAETLAANKTGIEWSTIPKVFQEAIEFTQKLGIRYLWIDSLCIIQGDLDDWRREAANMPQVYQNALLTIAATDSSDGSEGLFKSPNRLFRGVELKEHGQFPFSFFARVIPPHNLEHSPLLRRAWVYQERLLSQRMVHFTPSELIWECQQSMECQCSPEGNIFDNDRSLTQWDGRKTKIEHAQFLSSKINIEKRWTMIIQEYSRLQLSFYSDKLIALSGVAKEMHSFRPHDVYLAGMWKNNFVHDSLWRAGSPNQPRAIEWCAPTWSWASVQRGVDYDWVVDTRMDYSYTTVLEALCVPEDRDITGQLKSGMVVLSALITPVTIEYHIPDVLETQQVKHEVHVANRKLENFWADYALFADDPHVVRSREKLYCLKLGDIEIYGENGFGSYVIILRRLEESRPVFERIGIGAIDKVSSVEDIWERVEAKII